MRTVPEWIGRSDDDPVPDRVRVRVFLKFNGICQECKVKITEKRWVCDHRIAIANGGENRETNLGPIHEACDRKIKTPRDVKIKAKTYRIRKGDYPGLDWSRDSGELPSGGTIPGGRIGQCADLSGSLGPQVLARPCKPGAVLL